MLIPKLFLGLVSSAGIGGLVSLSSIAGGDTQDTWRISNNSTFPLFTCRASGSKISISLKLKDSVSHLRNNQQIEFWGEGNTSTGVSPFNLSDTVALDSKKYTLTVFQSGGSSQLKVGADSDSDFGATLYCDKNVFMVTGGTTTVGRSQAIVKELKDISLTLEKCEENGNKKPCSIKIGGDIGLSWRDDFIPKVIF